MHIFSTPTLQKKFYDAFSKIRYFLCNTQGYSITLKIHSLISSFPQSICITDIKSTKAAAEFSIFTFFISIIIIFTTKVKYYRSAIQSHNFVIILYSPIKKHQKPENVAALHLHLQLLARHKSRHDSHPCPSCSSRWIYITRHYVYILEKATGLYCIFNFSSRERKLDAFLACQRERERELLGRHELAQDTHVAPVIIFFTRTTKIIIIHNRKNFGRKTFP